jgi:hypothetical protein
VRRRIDIEADDVVQLGGIAKHVGGVGILLKTRSKS